MKVKISYSPHESDQVANDIKNYLQRYPNAKVRFSKRHPPINYAYISIKPTEDTNKIG